MEEKVWFVCGVCVNAFVNKPQKGKENSVATDKIRKGSKEKTKFEAVITSQGKEYKNTTIGLQCWGKKRELYDTERKKKCEVVNDRVANIISYVCE